MPDMKTALQTAMQKQQQDNAALHATINEWTQDDEQQTKPEPKEQAMPNPQPTYKINVVKTADNLVRFAPVNNVSRETFDYIKDNPGKTRKEIINALEAKGFKSSSVSSLIGQFMRCDHITQTNNGTFYARINEYTPLPSTKAQTILHRAKSLVQKKQPAPKKIVLVKPKVVQEPAGIAALNVDAGFDAKKLLDTLSVMQARALYDELKKIFGG